MLEGVKDKCKRTGLRLEILQARDRSDELDIHGSTKPKSILRKKPNGSGLDSSDKWQDVVNTVMNLGVI